MEYLSDLDKEFKEGYRSVLNSINTDNLKVILDFCYRLTELRKSSCDHLSIENAAPEIVCKVIRAIHFAPVMEFDAESNTIIPVPLKL